MGKCVVIVKAENGRIAVAYNEDGFPYRGSYSLNLNGFIISITEDGGCGEIFHKSPVALAGVLNAEDSGPMFNGDLALYEIRDRIGSSSLGWAYRKGPDIDDNALFGEVHFRFADYKMFKMLLNKLSLQFFNSYLS
jgi:hypothetical protein